jgi:hypothetical protein
MSVVEDSLFQGGYENGGSFGVLIVTVHLPAGIDRFAEVI